MKTNYHGVGDNLSSTQEHRHILRVMYPVTWPQKLKEEQERETQAWADKEGEEAAWAAVKSDLS